MQIIDRKNILQEIKVREKVVIELGCGNHPVIKNAITIDRVDVETVDIVADLNEGLGFLPDNCIDEIYSFHFLEHLDNVGFFMSEIYRVLKPGGKKIGCVPHFSNPYFYSDYTHHTFFGLYSFSYFSKQQYFKRGVPQFYNNVNFKINNLKLVFYSPFFVRNALRKIYMKMFNLNRYMQELYESSFCYTFPCHELSFELEKISDEWN